MIQTVKKQFLVQWRDWLWEFAAVFLIWLAGFGILQVIMADDGTSYLAVGTLLASVIEGIIVLLTETLSVGIYFNIQVAMGCTRKKFFVSYYLANGIKNLLIVLLLILLCGIETAYCRAIYPEMEKGLDMLSWLIKAGVPAVLALPAVGELCGALLIRFSRKAFWVMWVLWMLVSLGVPNMINAVEEDSRSLLGILGRQAATVLRAVPGSAWVFAGGAGMVLCIAAAWLLLRKQQVTG